MAFAPSVNTGTGGTSSSVRITIAVTMFLVAISFQYRISQYLPKLSYLTLIDQIVSQSLVFVFIVLLEVGMITFVVSHFTVNWYNDYDK